MKNNYLSLLEYKPTTSKDLLPSINIDYNYIEDDEFVVCYISDLHLDYKVSSLNKKETKIYLKNVITQLISSIPSMKNIVKLFLPEMWHLILIYINNFLLTIMSK